MNVPEFKVVKMLKMLPKLKTNKKYHYRCNTVNALDYILSRQQNRCTEMATTKSNNERF